MQYLYDLFLFSLFHLSLLYFTESDLVILTSYQDLTVYHKVELPVRYGYCGRILILPGQCLWIIKILLVHWDIISKVTRLLHSNIRQFIT